MTGMLLLNQLYSLIDRFGGKGLPFSVMGEAILLALPALLAIAAAGSASAITKAAASARARPASLAGVVRRCSAIFVSGGRICITTLP